MVECFIITYVCKFSFAESSLCERLTQAQNLSLDDQRGLAPQDIQLPDLLRWTLDDDSLSTGRESAPASLGREKSDSTTHQNARDIMAKIDTYIESINENFAAYTRESTPSGKTGRNAEVKRLPVNMSDRSFSEDGIVPSNEEAEKYFQVDSADDVDFNDPFLTDKSLTDIGFSYSHNKYLSKSRNFVNQRKKHLLTQSPHSVQQQELSLVSNETPNQTLRNDRLDQSDVLESTLLNSPHSSSYSSDSSLDKENFDKIVPKSRSSVPKISRHTLIHSPLYSPITGLGLDGDSFLSTVDTDGKLARHSTPKTPKGVWLLNAGRTPKILNSSTDKLSVSIEHTDKVTFV